MKTKIIYFALAAAARIGGGSYAWSRFRGSGTEDAAAQYETVAVKYGSIAQTVSTDGRVEALLVVDVKSKASGVVAEVLVNEADHLEGPDLAEETFSEIFHLPVYVLEPGELLMELDPVDEQRNVDKTSALLAAEMARFARTRAELAKLTETIEVDVGSARTDRLAAEAEREPLKAERDAAAAQRDATDQEVRTADINLKESRDLFDRQKQLLDERLTSREDYETARNKWERSKSEKLQAEGNVLVAKARVAQAEAKIVQLAFKLKQADAKIAVAEAQRGQIAVQKQEVKLAEANVRVAQVAVADARRRLDETRIVAPIDGVVLKKFVDKGQVIAGGAGNNASGGDKLLTVADVSRLFVMASVPEADIEMVRRVNDGPRQKVRITADALGTQVLEGEVVYRVPQATTENNVTTIKVRIEVTDKDKGKLLPGETCNVEIQAARKERALVVPAAAVLRGDRRDDRFVFIYDEEGKVKRRKVEVGITTATQAEITKGLAEGQQVVASAASVDQPSSKRGGGSGKGEAKQFRPPGMR